MARSKNVAKNLEIFMDSVKDVPYKIFYFTFYAGYMPLLLYLPVYFKYIGLSPLNIGILNGIRPILQCVGTPILVLVGERFNSKKLLLVISSFIMIGKVLIIFLFLRPAHQKCTLDYINTTHDISTTQQSYFLPHKLTKRTTNDGLATEDTDLWLFKKSLDPPSTPAITTLNTKSVNSNHNKIPWQEKRLNKTVTTRYFLTNDSSEVNRIFIALIILAILGDSFESAIFTLVDHSCVVNMKVENYGVIRLWGNIGWGMMTPIIGIIIHRFDHEFCGKILGSFHYVFFFFIGFSYVAMLVGSNLHFTETPNDVVSQEIHNVQNNFQYGMFLFASAYSGFCNGFLFTFVNWFIDDLGGNALIMGISTGLKCIVDVSLFYLLEKIIEYFGHVATLSASFIGYILLFLIYFAIKQAWLVILAEILHAVVYAVMTATSVAFLIYAAPAGSSPKMQGVLQGIYWGMGTGCGSIFGGYCVNSVGFPKTFLSFAVITCIVAFIFLAMQLLSYFGKDDDDDGTEFDSNTEFDGDDEEETTDEDVEAEKIDWEAIKPTEGTYQGGR